MTKTQAFAAMEDETVVEAGNGEDYDYGKIIEIDGNLALVAWQGSESRTPCPISMLEVKL